MNRILDIEKNDEIIINISQADFNKLNVTIKNMKIKYEKEIQKLYSIEQKNTKNFDFVIFKKEILEEKSIIISILKDVLLIYEGELINLECVFLSGSYARETNKLASDLDLHFFYKNGKYNLKYEEIISYVISRIINKSRDCIDPTFILNLSSKYKKIVTDKMTTNKLIILLKSPNKTIKYSYKQAKKRRFFLQYNNSRKLFDLQNYILNEVKKDNLEWTHSFDIIYGKDTFNKYYSEILDIEKNILNKSYIICRTENLIKKISIFNGNLDNLCISNIKKKYQSEVNEIIYEYILIIRFMLVHNGININYIKIFEMYKVLKQHNYNFYKTIEIIYEYLWNLRKLTVYCHDNKINYGLHNCDTINYDVSYLNEEYEKLKQYLLGDLTKIRRFL